MSIFNQAQHLQQAYAGVKNIIDNANKTTPSVHFQKTAITLDQNKIPTTNGKAEFEKTAITLNPVNQRYNVNNNQNPNIKTNPNSQGNGSNINHGSSSGNNLNITIPTPTQNMQDKISQINNNLNSSILQNNSNMLNQQRNMFLNNQSVIGLQPSLKQLQQQQGFFQGFMSSVNQRISNAVQQNKIKQMQNPNYSPELAYLYPSTQSLTGANELFFNTATMNLPSAVASLENIMSSKGRNILKVHETALETQGVNPKLAKIESYANPILNVGLTAVGIGKGISELKINSDINALKGKPTEFIATTENLDNGLQKVNVMSRTGNKLTQFSNQIVNTNEQGVSGSKIQGMSWFKNNKPELFSGAGVNRPLGEGRVQQPSIIKGTNPINNLDFNLKSTNTLFSGEQSGLSAGITKIATGELKTSSIIGSTNQFKEGLVKFVGGEAPTTKGGLLKVTFEQGKISLRTNPNIKGFIFTAPDTNEGTGIKILTPSADFKGTPFSETFGKLKIDTTIQKSVTDQLAIQKASINDLIGFREPKPITILDKNNPSIFAGQGNYEQSTGGLTPQTKLTTNIFEPTKVQGKNFIDYGKNDISPLDTGFSLNSVIKLDTQNKTGLLTGLDLSNGTKSDYVLKIDIVPSQIDFQIPIITSIPKLKEEQLTTQGTINIFRNPNNYNRQKEDYKIPLLELLKKNRGKMKEKLLFKQPDKFSVYFKKRGKNVKLGDYLSLQQSERALSNKLLSDLSASGFVLKNNQPLKSSELLKDFNQNLFRQSKNKKNPFSIVQKRNSRLSSFGEKQDIKSARKNKKLFNFRNNKQPSLFNF